VTGSHAAIKPARVFQLLGMAERPDAGRTKRRTDSFAFVGRNRVTIDENLYLLTAGNPTFNPKIFAARFHCNSIFWL
jgi:hypothetical protein